MFLKEHVLTDKTGVPHRDITHSLTDKKVALIMTHSKYDEYFG